MRQGQPDRAELGHAGCRGVEDAPRDQQVRDRVGIGERHVPVQEVQVAGDGRGGRRDRRHGQPGVLRVEQTADDAAGPALTRDLQREPEQADQRAEDHGELRPGLLTGLPREMLDGALDDAGAPEAQLREEFRRYGRRLTLEDDPVQGALLDQLVGAVHVPDAHLEQETAGGCPQDGVDAAKPGVGSLGAVADDRVRALTARHVQELRELRCLELPVGIGQEQPPVAVVLQRGGDAGRHGGAVAAVDLVVDHDHPTRVLGRESLRDLAGPVRAPVVDDNDTVRDPSRLGDLQEVGDGGGEGLLLAVRRHDDGDAIARHRAGHARMCPGRRGGLRLWARIAGHGRSHESHG